jgi:hypothetical protein
MAVTGAFSVKRLVMATMARIRVLAEMRILLLTTKLRAPSGFPTLSNPIRVKGKVAPVLN